MNDNAILGCALAALAVFACTASGETGDTTGADSSGTTTVTSTGVGGNTAATTSAATTTSTTATTGTSMGSGYAGIVVSDGPVAYWRLGESSGTNAADTAGSNDGTYTGSFTLAEGGAISGDSDTATGFGTDATVMAGDKLDFTGTNPFSIEAWVNPTTITSEYRGIVSKEIDDNGRQGYFIYLHEVDGLGFERWRDDNGDDNIKTGAEGAPKVGQYSHIVATFDGFTMRLFMNGIEAASSGATSGLKDHNNEVVIGARFSGAQNFFEGRIDEVAVYDKALSAERVTAHYQAGAP